MQPMIVVKALVDKFFIHTTVLQ